MVQPALRENEWREGRVSWLRESGVVLSLAGDLGLLIEGSQHITIGKSGARLTALIAMANAALSDDDPRKLKRVHVEALRAAATGGSKTDGSDGDLLTDLANALESYLPAE